MRPRLAPTARRTAISRRRAVPRASIRFATFAQTISNTAPTAIVSTRSAGRLAATICSFTPSISKRRTPAGSGREKGPAVGFGRTLFAERIGFIGCRLDGRAILQAGNHAAGKPLSGGRALGDRRPIVRVGNREVEALRHDADDGQRCSVEEPGFRSERLECDAAPDDAGIALEVALPRTGADDDDVRAGNVVARNERAAKPCARAEHGECVGRHQRAGQARGAR